MSKQAHGILVSDIQRGAPDHRGDVVQEIYVVSSQNYVVYCAANRVRVIYADDPQKAKLQRDIFAPLEVLRGEILAQTEGWLTAEVDSTTSRRLQSYNRRLADGLSLAFRNLPEAAKAALEAVRNDLQRERLVIGRQQYFAMAVGMAAIWVLLFAAVSRSHPPAEQAFPWLLTQIVGAGCFGAVFSIMLNLSSRQIQPDFLRPQNLMDALLRISIASMSAIVLYALLRAQLVDFSVNGTSLGAAFEGEIQGLGPLGFLACFFAGFSEKLVGNFVSVADLGLKTGASAQAKAGEAEAEAAAQKASAVTRGESLLGGPLGAPPPAGVEALTLALPALRGPAGAPAKGTEEEEHVDGCACDMHDQHDTSDEELPPARGGVAQ